MSLNFENLKKESARRDKASKMNDKPFEYTTSDGKVIEIPFPTAADYIAISSLENANDVAAQLNILLDGSPAKFRALMADFDELHPSAVNVLTEEMWDFWGTDIQSTPGKSQA